MRCSESLASLVSLSIGAVVLALSVATPAGAQSAASAEAAPPTASRDKPSGTSNPFQHLNFGAALEGYYQYNWNRPPDRINLLRAYDTRSNVFSLQQAVIVVESVPDVDAGRRFGGRIDLQFGQATETVQGNPANEPRPDAYRHVWQAYGTYVFDAGRGLTMDFGKFASNLGFETNYAKDNNQFSRAYLFNFLPFYHAGVRLTLPVNDKVTLMYMLTNGIQQNEDFNNFKSHHVTAIIKPASRVTWTTSFYAGQEQADGGQPDGPDGYFTVLDSYASFAVTSALSLGLDLNRVTSEVRRADPSLLLEGLGGYARYQFSPERAVAVRYERLDDEGLFGGIDQVLQELTATLEHKFAEGFLVRGEFRRDWSDTPFFTGRRPGELRKHQNTALVGLVWWFGNKSGAW